MELRIRRINDLENAPRLQNGAYNLEGSEFVDSVNLNGVDLQGANLKDVDVRFATFVGANLQGANLQGANLKRSVFREAQLSNADLSGANLSFAVLRGANLTGANLTNANLTGATLTGAILTDAVFTGAILSDVIGINPTDAIFTGAIFSNIFTITPRQRPQFHPVPQARATTLWTQDEDCVGQEDPVTMEAIPAGRGFRLEAENRCYDALTLAEMRRLNRPMVGPMSRIPFTQNDIRRINEFRAANPNIRVTGGKKRRKTKKIRKSKRRRMTIKNRKNYRRMK